MAAITVGHTWYVEAEQDAWYWSEVWQERLARARDDIAAGRVIECESAEAMFADLDSDESIPSETNPG